MENQEIKQPRSQGLSSSLLLSSTTPSCGKTKDPGNEVGNQEPEPDK